MTEELQESDGSGCSATTEEKQAIFYQWKLRHYFTVVEEDDKNMRVQCKYLSDAKKLECLRKYPTVKKVSLNYNTTTPSSAPVEWLFCLGVLVLIPK